MSRLTLIAMLLLGVSGDARLRAVQAEPHRGVPGVSAPGVSAIDDAQALFYNAHYDSAAESALAIVRADPTDMAGYELRSTALLFQIRRAVGDAADKDKALKQCARCAQVMADFLADTSSGQAEARTRLKADPKNEAALFYLGKLDLNHVWLHLGTLGHRTGWNEYWEARHSLDAVLEGHPHHVRARVARAWIDYIVDTKMSWGTRWVLGGGNKRKALLAMRDAAGTQDSYFNTVEARFALWDVHVRERNYGEAVVVARALSTDFPLNAELTRFIDKYSSTLKP